MIKIKNTGRYIFVAACLSMGLSESHAVDSVAFEAGGGDKVRLLRVSAQWDWQRQWLKFNGVHLGGYWDVNLAQWHSTQYQNISGNTQNIYVLGITPVFRLQSDTGRGLYGEAGVGANLLSHLYNNAGHRLSTSFEFGSHLGVGYVFANNMDLSVRVQHFSNGGIKEPNSGVNFAALRFGYHF
jgi:lipid A 3-O-deacylase